jgi:hypothetical protein
VSTAAVIDVPSAIMFLCSPERGWTAPPASPASLLPVPPLRVTGSAEHVRQLRTGVVRLAVIDSGGCGWQREGGACYLRQAPPHLLNTCAVRITVALAKHSVQAAGSPARTGTPDRPATG